MARKLTKGQRRSRVVAFGVLWLRFQLFLVGAGFLVLAVVFLFIPVDGPFGEISFAALGFWAIALAIGGRVPTASVAQKLVAGGRRTQRAVETVRRRRQ